MAFRHAYDELSGVCLFTLPAALPMPRNESIAIHLRATSPFATDTKSHPSRMTVPQGRSMESTRVYRAELHLHCPMVHVALHTNADRTNVAIISFAGRTSRGRGCVILNYGDTNRG